MTLKEFRETKLPYKALFFSVGKSVMYEAYMASLLIAVVSYFFNRTVTITALCVMLVLEFVHYVAWRALSKVNYRERVRLAKFLITHPLVLKTTNDTYFDAVKMAQNSKRIFHEMVEDLADEKEIQPILVETMQYVDDFESYVSSESQRLQGKVTVDKLGQPSEATDICKKGLSYMQTFNAILEAYHTRDMIYLKKMCTELTQLKY